MSADRTASRIANLVLSALAIAPFATAAAILVRVWLAGAGDLTPFVSALPGSFLIAIGVGLVALLLVLRLSPALIEGKSSSTTRVVGLSFAMFSPPIILVLVGALALNTSPLWQPWLPLLLQVLTTYPFIALAAAIALEPELRAVAVLGLGSRGRRGGSAGMALRLIPTASATLLMLASSVAFQGYLINLLIRAEPQQDALVAMMALFPHTGIAWRSGLLAILAIWAGYLALSVAVSLKFVSQPSAS